MFYIIFEIAGSEIKNSDNFSKFSNFFFSEYSFSVSDPYQILKLNSNKTIAQISQSDLHSRISSLYIDPDKKQRILSTWLLIFLANV